MMNDTFITPSQTEAVKRVVGNYLSGERKNAEANIDEVDVVWGMSELSDEEFYMRYKGHYGHVWFDLYVLSKIN
jgi:hypothetical protein